MKPDHPRFANTLISLDNTPYDYLKTSIPAYEGEFLRSLIVENRYQKTIEIGLALGVSALYICEATVHFEEPRHTIIDPHQSDTWSNIGLQNLRKYGINHYTLLEEPSEIALPKLLEQGESFDFAFIDGWHTFDHALVDFFYLNRLIRLGGMIVLDDANWASISKLLGYVSKYPSYELILPDEGIFKPAILGLRRKIFQVFCATTKLIPINLRKELFSDRVNFGLISHFPKVVALKKIAEDKRSWTWYEPF